MTDPIKGTDPGADNGVELGSESVSYVGNTAPAPIAQANARQLLTTAVKASATAGSVSLRGHAQGGLPGIVGPVSAETVVPCDSGELRIGRELDAAGAGKITFTYNVCAFGDSVTDGVMTAVVRSAHADGSPADFTLYYNRVALSGAGIGQLTGGFIDVELLASGDETIDLNLTTYDAVAGTYSKSEGLRVQWDAATKRETVNGRVFHSQLGYIDVSTPTPLTYPGIYGQPSTGSLQLTGGDGTRAGARSATGGYAQLEVDQNGDGLFESPEAIAWTDLM